MEPGGDIDLPAGDPAPGDRAAGDRDPAMVGWNGAGRLVVPVLLDGWQLECCGTPPAVGQRVSWQLNWTPEYGERLPSDLALRARVKALSEPGEDSWFALAGPIDPAAERGVPALATAHGVTVFVEAPPHPPEHLTFTGVLHEDHHVDVPVDMPVTTGTVVAVWLVSWAYERRQGNTWYRIDGSARTHRVDEAPTWLPGGADHRDPDRSTDDVLVHLEVDPLDPG